MRTIRSWLKMVSISVLFTISSVVIGSDNTAQTVAGDWQTIDHKTNQPSSVIHIWKSHGKYYGKIAKIYHPSPEQSKYGNQPILGLTIMHDFVDLGAGKYGKGRILDPSSGKTYHCHLRLIDQGKRLKVRGFIGISLLGRTDIWVRIPSS